MIVFIKSTILQICVFMALVLGPWLFYQNVFFHFHTLYGTFYTETIPVSIHIQGRHQQRKPLRIR